MAAPEESRVHGRCHRCVWPRGEGPPQPPAESSLPQGGHGSLPAEPALPRPRLPSGKGTGDTRVPRWHLFLPCAPQWRASENDICHNGAAERGGQAAKRRSARGRGRRGVRPAGSGLTLVGPCVGARKHLRAALHFSRSQEWDCGGSPGALVQDNESLLPPDAATGYRGTQGVA